MGAWDSFSLDESQDVQLGDVTSDDGIPALSSTTHHPKSGSPETAPQKRRILQSCFAPSIQMLSFAYGALICMCGAVFS